MQVADVNGVRIDGLLFDAGTINSAALLTVGTAGSTVSHASDPISVQDTFFRIGGDIAGQATASLVVNANDTIVDDIWAWRADHGNSGTVGWTTNTAANGMTVNGNNVEATGLFVEHYQKTEVAWNGQNGKVIFFQNEMPYDPPNQAAWMNGSSNGYPAIAVASNVTSFGAWGLGSYCYFNVNPAVNSAMAFQSPTGSGIAWHDLLTVSLGQRRHDQPRDQHDRCGHADQHHAEHRDQFPVTALSPSPPAGPAPSRGRPAASSRGLALDADLGRD